jgi:hypothetical protein
MGEIADDCHDRMQDELEDREAEFGDNPWFSGVNYHASSTCRHGINSWSCPYCRDSSRNLSLF